MQEIRARIDRLGTMPVTVNQLESDEKADEGIVVGAAISPCFERGDLIRIAQTRRWKLIVSTSWQESAILMRNRTVPVVLLHRSLLEPDWRQALRTILTASARPSALVISPDTSNSFWEAVIRLGGYDVLPTPLSETQVVHAVQAAWKFWRRCRAPFYGDRPTSADSSFAG